MAISRPSTRAVGALLGGSVLRSTIAYPVFLLDYEAQRQRWAASSGIDGLISVGRNGEFDHILMEDIYWRTLKTCREIVSRRLAQ